MRIPRRREAEDFTLRAPIYFYPLSGMTAPRRGRRARERE